MVTQAIMLAKKPHVVIGESVLLLSILIALKHYLV
jgi:hypothetical protein